MKLFREEIYKQLDKDATAFVNVFTQLPYKDYVSLDLLQKLLPLLKLSPGKLEQIMDELCGEHIANIFTTRENVRVFQLCPVFMDIVRFEMGECGEYEHAKKIAEKLVRMHDPAAVDKLYTSSSR